MSTLHPLKEEQDLHGNGLEGGFLVFGTVIPNTKAYSYKVCHYDEFSISQKKMVEHTPSD